MTVLCVPYLLAVTVLHVPYSLAVTVLYVPYSCRDCLICAIFAELVLIKALPDAEVLPVLLGDARVVAALTVFFFFFITLGLELSDTKVYEP